MKKYIDYSLLVAMIFLLCFGLIMLYSASYYEAQIHGKEATYFLKKQLIFVAFGFVGMFVVSRIPYQVYKKFSFPIYIISIIAILLVLSPIGNEVNGALRWLKIGGSTVQPVEIGKIGIIIYVAGLISKKGRPVEKISTLFGVVLRLFFMILPVVFITRDLSSAIVLFFIASVMLFVSSKKVMQFIILGMVGVIAILGFIQFGFRAARIDAWLSPETAEKGGQVLQSLYAIGSGGWFGKGLGNSVQKLGFIPESQNDMIFSIISEELGVFGASCLILMFMFLIWRMLVIANNTEDLFGWLLVVGVMAHIGIQVLLNVAVATNSIPNTGVTLPFVSSGGSALFFMMIEVGIVFSVSRNIKSNY